jgi:hypothetical protein
MTTKSKSAAIALKVYTRQRVQAIILPSKNTPFDYSFVFN